MKVKFIELESSVGRDRGWILVNEFKFKFEIKNYFRIFIGKYVGCNICN